MDVNTSTSLNEVIRLISKATKLSANRIRVTMPLTEDKPANGDKKKHSGYVPKPDETVGDLYATEDSLTFYVKDLGMQISWRMVYIIEYLGPLLFHPLFYYTQKQIYGVRFDHSRDQQLIFIFSMLHFLKREYETLFVHKFSMDTMPFVYVFRNSAHYWILSGLFLAYFNYAPPTYFLADSPLIMRLLFKRQWIPTSENALHAITALWVYAELSNFWTHLTLASLRTGNDKGRKIPRGYGFDLVSFPNYFFESLGWLAVTLTSQNLSNLVFLTVGTLTMFNWAVRKHKRYRRDFPDYPRNRKVMFPFVY